MEIVVCEHTESGAAPLTHIPTLFAHFQRGSLGSVCSAGKAQRCSNCFDAEHYI